MTNATTNEDTQTTPRAWSSAAAAGDGAETTHFKVTNITNGTLFQHDGTTPITNNSFITFAQANAGLKFTPAANFFGTGTFQVQASSSSVDGGSGRQRGHRHDHGQRGRRYAERDRCHDQRRHPDHQRPGHHAQRRSTAPKSRTSRSPASPAARCILARRHHGDHQRHVPDVRPGQRRAEVHADGQLLRHRLRSSVQASTSNVDAGLGGSVRHRHDHGQPRRRHAAVTGATINQNTQTTSGLVICRNAADGAEVTHFKITGISNGTLYQNDGATPITNGSFITFAQGNAGLKFTPAPTTSAPPRSACRPRSAMSMPAWAAAWSRPRSSVNAIPVLSGVPTSVTINEVAAYTFTASANDADCRPSR